MMKNLLAALVFAALLVLPGPPSANAQDAGVIDGAIVNGTAGAAPPANLEVVVHILQNRVKTGERRVQTDAAGRFHVDGLQAAPDVLYFPIVTYGGVAYYPDRPVTLDGASPGQTEITVFEGTPSGEGIAFDRLNMLVMGVTPSALTIMEMGGVANSGDRTFAADAQVTGSARTLRFLLPPGAINVTPQAGLPADSLESMPDGFASTDPIRPGRREIAFSYDLPYTSATIDLARSFAFPVTAFTLYVPNDVGAVVPDGIAMPGTAELGGRQFRQYVIQDVAPGSVVRLRLTGLPAPLFSTPRELGIAVGAATGAILLVFLVIGLRRRSSADPDAAVTSAASPQPRILADDGLSRDAQLLAIAQLDELFAAGDLEEGAYRSERAARKARLLAERQQAVGAS